MSEGQKCIMAIGAHIGDAELTCGKTLAKHSIIGDKIVTVALTAGERGAPPSIPIDEFKRRNIESAGKFAEMLKGESVVLDYRDGELPVNDEVKFRVCDIIRRYKPSVVLTHWKNSMHKDHTACHRIVTDAVFYAALASIERELPAHWARGPYFAENWEDAVDFQPYFFVDVTEGFDLWNEAIGLLWLTDNSPWFKYREYYEALTRTRGALCRKQRAECFAVDMTTLKQTISGF